MGQKAEVVLTTSVHWEEYHRWPRFFLTGGKKSLLVALGPRSCRVAAGQEPRQQAEESYFYMVSRTVA